MTDTYQALEIKISESSKDDLTKIKGIGTTTAEKLYNAKIVSVQQITEMTPARLSETPGIGLATATKFIAAAKDLLETFQKEVVVSEPTQIQEEIKVKSSPPSIEQYEVEQVIVEEVKAMDVVEEIKEEPRSQVEVEEDFKSEQTQKKWFSDKYNYSRLTNSYPPISERAKNPNEAIEGEELKPEAKTITVIDSKPEESFIEADLEVGTQPKIDHQTDYEEDQIESKEIQLQQEEEIGIYYIRGGPKYQILDIFTGIGCSEIPGSLQSLKRFTTELDYLGCKVVKISDDLKIIFMFPVKIFDSKGTVLVDEAKVDLKSHSSETDLRAYYDIDQVTKNLLQVRDLMYEDVASDSNILTFFQKYLQINLSLEKGFGAKSLVFLSGNVQYKVFIEPILLCYSYNPPRSMEKSLVFPYQRSTNLHAVTMSDLAPLVKFLEKKYRMIEIERTKKTSSLKDYKQAEVTFRSSVRYASIPVFVFSATLLIIYFAELYFLLRLFNTIGFAGVGIYLSLLAFFYFKSYKTKEKFTDQFETPYYLQNLEFSETDLLDFRAELTDELMTQFGYECLEKDAKFGVMERSEANALKHNDDLKRAEPELKKMFEPKQENTKPVSNSTASYKTKYSSFLEDP